MADTALTFTFSAQSLRAVMIDGEPWFIAADLLEALALDRKALERLDDDEKGTHIVQTPGGDQSMTIINESGLYSLILTSRKPEAKKFKKWVTSEVLPAIRKTGHYSAQPVPQQAAEAISPRDLLAITRVIWLIASSFRFEKVWVQGIWFYLRRALAAPAPQRFNVAQMPAIGHELGYLLASAHGVRELLNEIELQAARRILRKGEPPEVVLASLRRQADKALQRMAAIPQQGLPAWLHHDLAALSTERTRPIHWAPVLEGCAEQPDFFRQGAAS